MGNATKTSLDINKAWLVMIMIIVDACCDCDQCDRCNVSFSLFPLAWLSSLLWLEVFLLSWYSYRYFLDLVRWWWLLEFLLVGWSSKSFPCRCFSILIGDVSFWVFCWLVAAQSPEMAHMNIWAWAYYYFIWNVYKEFLFLNLCIELVMVN